MAPICFRCEETLAITPQAIVEEILNLDRWPEFPGYGPLPGIASAEFETRTPEVVGTRIRVTNTDGSNHVEQIVEWQPDSRLIIHLQEFSPPLSRLATHFEEIWEFEPRDGETRVGRTFRLHPRSPLSRPVMWLVSKMLRRAVDRHLQQMRDDLAT